MKYRKYQHIERFGVSPEVKDIELGHCVIFPKIDGTNSQLFLGDDGIIKGGSRNRELSLDSDNQGFYAWALQQDNIKRFFNDHPDMRLYGEWLVKHTISYYRDDAWRRFYVFDVTQETDDNYRYLPYAEYKEIMEQYDIDYIPPIITIENPSYDRLINQLKSANFLVQDGKGDGEGIVIKNYSYVNKFERTTWAKIVASEFKEKHVKTMGAPDVKGKQRIEIEIVDNFVTKAMCEKVYAKINNDVGWTSKMIPRLLNTAFYDLIQEESWNFINKYKNPTINFSTLYHFTIQKIKEHLPQLF